MNCLFCSTNLTLPDLKGLAYCNNCTKDNKYTKDSIYISYLIENQQMQDCWIAFYTTHGAFLAKLFLHSQTLQICPKFGDDTLVSVSLPPIISLDQIVKLSENLIQRVYSLKSFLWALIVSSVIPPNHPTNMLLFVPIAWNNIPIFISHSFSIMISPKLSLSLPSIPKISCSPSI